MCTSTFLPRAASRVMVPFPPLSLETRLIYMEGLPPRCETTQDDVSLTDTTGS